MISKYLLPGVHLISTTSLSGLSGFYVETDENTELMSPVSVFYEAFFFLISKLYNLFLSIPIILGYLFPLELILMT